jgi:hypothetical protein
MLYGFVGRSQQKTNICSSSSETFIFSNSGASPAWDLAAPSDFHNRSEFLNNSYFPTVRSCLQFSVATIHRGQPERGPYVTCWFWRIWIQQGELDIEVFDTFLLMRPPNMILAYFYVYDSQYSNWLRAGRLRGRSSSPGRVKTLHFSMSSRSVLMFPQPPIQ